MRPYQPQFTEGGVVLHHSYSCEHGSFPVQSTRFDALVTASIGYKHDELVLLGHPIETS